MKILSLDQVMQLLPSTGKLFLHGAAATPHKLIKGLCKNPERFTNLEILHLHTIGEPCYADKKYEKSFRVSNFFIGANMRKLVDYDRIDYIPCFLSEIPLFFKKGIKKLDVAFIHVSPPDHHGYCTLGTSCDVTRAAVDTATLVVAQINPRMPRVHGDGVIHSSLIDYGVEVNEALPESTLPELSKEAQAIGQFVAGLIEDGSTLQMGIGSIPNAVLKYLTNHKNLGLHSEMWSDGALPLIESGVINNSKKKIHPHKSVSTFLFGSQKLYDFVHDNAAIVQLDVSYVNNPAVIARNKKVCAINSAVEVDLTGQVCADSIGTHIISGVGGQIDFIRGASLSEGGKPIIAMTSRTAKGSPRLVSMLHHGAGVVTTRAHVHYVVTEFGAVDLFGKSLNERARELISIAHPEDREVLSREWFEIKMH